MFPYKLTCIHMNAYKLNKKKYIRKIRNIYILYEYNMYKNK